MKPKEFSWTEDQQVTVTNPTPVTHKFKVHSKEYELGAGKMAKMPGYIAWVYVYEMAVKMAQEDKVFNRWNEEGFRKEYFEKLVSGVDPLMQAVEIEEQPLVQTLDDEELPEEPVAEPKPETPVPVAEAEQTAKPGITPMKAKPRERSARV